MSYQKYKETIKATNVARREAVKVLIDKHRDEFDQLYLTEASKIGLTPTKTRAKVIRVAESKLVPMLSED
jgi:hypothetical protein